MLEKLINGCSQAVTSHWTATDWQIVFGVLILFVVVIGIVVVRRIASGDDLKIFKWVTLTANKQVQDLQQTVNELSKDDKLKRRVLWLLRDHLTEMTAIIASGCPPAQIQGWCNRILIDIAAAVSRGGEEQHRVSVWFCPTAGGPLKMYAAHGFRADSVRDAELSLNSCAGRVYQTGQGEIIPDVTQDASYQPKQRRGPAYMSMISLPVTNEAGEVVGVLCIDALAQGYFDEDDKFIASCFADLLDTLLARVLRRA